MTFAGLVHRPTPLRLLAGLAALPAEAEVEFTNLRDLLGLTDGNLSAHLSRLDEAGYVSFLTTVVGRKARTFI
uniref:ArsR family transcriptional regulator n=1 Tax=Thermomicrobium roseum TaxID=500 RepID=A0A7C1XK06_THERO